MKKLLSALLSLILIFPILPVRAYESPLFPGEEIAPIVSTKATSTADHKSWGTTHVGADVLANKLAKSGRDEEIIVAVIDTGVNSKHPYLQGRLVPGRNTNGGDYYNSEDDNGHGTLMASMIVDATLDLPNVKIMPIKVSNGNKWDIEWILKGIDEAISHGASVINLSLGLEIKSGSPTNTVSVASFENAVRKAQNYGITVVAAAGNEGTSANHLTPARMPEVITVAASDSNDNIPSFSNYGPSIDVTAPGCGVIGASKTGFAIADGTSPAAALVSAICAMIKLNNPTYSPEQIKSTLIGYCTIKGAVGWNEQYGNGIPNVKSMPVNMITPPEEGGNKNINNYTDVLGHWSEQAIAAMIPIGVVSGYAIAGGRYEFLPQKTITRAEFVKMLAALSEDHISSWAEYSPSTDVPANAWHAPYFIWATQNNIVKGYDSGELRPNDNISRQEMAVILVRYAEYTNTNLASDGLWHWASDPANQLADDEKIASWALESMLLARRAKIIIGDSYGNGNPTQNATRAESVTMIWKFSLIE